ncbi:hypothetical protein EJF36_02475 [Bacillus sp. HMF5848]|uniref:hypothetical protein n=1 Tax=Bacillus sp. HMF5848 TaxID=2495421 RepID=UPI000F77F680|nr:hypothetical protein [Bacillus sp. HMF5848]RSK25846.1 hypothetical protein EJF36_02475 [Bacillus sp. HMF5848]
MNSNDLPLLVAGPIVRRVEPTQVFIWIATSQYVNVEAALFHIQDDKDEQALPLKNHVSSIQMGQRLYIHMLKVTPKTGEFPTNEVLGYNLKFLMNRKYYDLGDLGLLSEENPTCIVYEGMKYPTFIIQTDERTSRILYGSCRKVHGMGNDMLSEADEMIQESVSDPSKRPQNLFLMGDQIYADDVPAPLIQALSQIGDILIGRKEAFEQIEPRLKQTPFATSINQINGRQFIMKHMCHFTSSSASNHLMTLGEFAAMYAMAWSPALWEFANEQHLFKSFDEAYLKNQVYVAFHNKSLYPTHYKKEKQHLKERYVEQQEQLADFQQSLYSVRRVLANISTYMIFDDHEVTDDWNITATWQKNVRQSPLGKHIIANGLTAYWVFQGWGNAPDSFDSHFLSVVGNYLRTLQSGYAKSLHYKWTEMLWNFNNWYFVAPTSPRAVFLDTRTMRNYEDTPKPIKIGSLIEETSRPPQLVQTTQWEQLHEQLKKDWKAGAPLLIVSPTPVYGFGLIESILHNYVYPLKILGVQVNTTFDFEAWKYNGKGFTSFLEQVSNWNPAPCIILSGDVHYGAAVKSDVIFSDHSTLSIHQFTSSPLKNMSFSGIWGFMLKQVSQLNSLKRKGKTIHRYCDKNYNIRHEKEDEITLDPFLWKDSLQYQQVGHLIIETKNNIGLLCMDSIER